MANSKNIKCLGILVLFLFMPILIIFRVPKVYFDSVVLLGCGYIYNLTSC